MKEFLYTLYRSLCSINVRGKDDMETVLGCLQAIEHEIAKIEAEEATGEEEE